MWIFLWLLFGIFSAVIASNKNRSAVAWFFIGLFFGPFGLVVGFLDKVKTIPDNNSDARTESIKNVASTSNAPKNTIYTIKVKDLEECWNNARSTLLNHYNENFPNKFKIKKNDKEELYASGYFEDFYESQYYKMNPELRKDGEYIVIDAMDGIDFSNIGQVFKASESTEQKNDSTNIDDFMKLAELYKQGLLTDEEFEAQKKKYL